MRESVPMLDTLRRITLALTEATDLDEGLALVVHGVKAHLAADACSVRSRMDSKRHAGTAFFCKAVVANPMRH